MKKSYKVLMYANTFINYDMLGEGLYSTSIPILFSEETTIESLMKEYEKTILKSDLTKFFIEYNGKNFVENLFKCELNEITLSYN